jgi:hypothetical protein
MNFRRTLITAAIILTLSGTVHAATLYTPPLIPRESSVLECHIVNVSSETRTITVILFDSIGDIVTQSGPLPLDPKQLVIVAGPPSLEAGWCQFTVDGHALTVRASGAIYPVSSGSPAAVVPAQ